MESKSGLIEKLKGILRFENITIKNFINLNDEEVEMVRRWRNHTDIRKWMYTDHEINIEEHKNFIENLKRDNRNFYYLVYLADKPIGVFSLNRVDWRNGNAYIGVYANPEEKTKGAGDVLSRSLLFVAFTLIGLHTLKLEVIEDNERAIKFYKRMGFKEEGKLKEFVLKEGKRKDVIVMGLINPKSL